MEHGLALAMAANRYTFGNIAVYRLAFLAGCSDGVFPVAPLMRRAMQAQRCSAELYTGAWENVGTAEQLAALNGASAPPGDGGGGQE